MVVVAVPPLLLPPCGASVVELGMIFLMLISSVSEKGIFFISIRNFASIGINKSISMRIIISKNNKYEHKNKYDIHHDLLNIQYKK